MGDVKALALPTIREAADMVGVKPRVLKRRLLKLHARSKNVLVSFEEDGRKVRKWHVKPAGLLLAMREDPKITDERFAEIEMRVNELETRQVALRNTLRAHRREDREWKKRHESIANKLSSALENIAEASSLLVDHRRPSSTTPSQRGV